MGGGVPVFGGDGDLGGHFWGRDVDWVFWIDDEWVWDVKAGMESIDVSYILPVALRVRMAGRRVPEVSAWNRGIRLGVPIRGRPNSSPRPLLSRTFHLHCQASDL